MHIREMVGAQARHGTAHTHTLIHNQTHVNTVAQLLQPIEVRTNVYKAFKPFSLRVVRLV